MLYERVFVCGFWGEEEDVWRCWCLGKEFAVGVDVGRVMDESVSAILPELQTTFFIFRFISCNISFSRMVLAYHPTHPVEILSAFSLPNFELFNSTEALPLTHPLLTTPK